MADERDPKVSAAYRALGAEEPPRALDDAILAAARRKSGAGPAPLAQRTGRQRWYAPLATAAVLVLAVAMTLNMQSERPGIESPVPQAAAPAPAADRAVAKQSELEADTRAKLEVAAPVAAEKSTLTQRKATRPAAVADARVARSKDDAAAAGEPNPFMAEKPALAGSASSEVSRNVAPSAAGSMSQPLEKRAESAERADRGAGAAPAAAPARLQAQKVADTPERELERIAELRAQGKHDEADKALAEFRKRNPDYRISEAMRARIERR